MIRVPLHYCVLCMSLGAAASAQADTSAAINVSNIQYVLTDLDPGDGIAPALTWVSPFSQSSIRLAAQTGVFGMGSVSPAYSTPVTQAQTNATDLFAATQIHEGTDSALTTAGGGLTVNVALPASGADLFAYAVQGGYFTLTPHTAVTFSADYTQSISGTVPAGAPEPNGYMDWAYFQTVGDVQFGQWNDFLGPGSAVFGGPDVQTYVRSDVGLPSLQTDSRSGPASQTITNDSGDVLSTNIGILASVDAYTVAPLSAVPEPSSWALLVVGGLILAPIHRRRGRSSRNPA